MSGYQRQKTYAFRQQSSLITSRTSRALLLGYHTGPGGTQAHHQVPGWSFGLGVGDLTRQHKEFAGRTHSLRRAAGINPTCLYSLHSGLWARAIAGSDGEMLSTPPEPPAPVLDRASQPRARTTLPIGLSGATLWSLQLQAPPRPRDRPLQGPAPLQRRRTFLSGGQRPVRDRERDGEPGPPAVRVGFAIVRACKLRAV